MQMENEDEKFVLRMDRREIVMVISALGWVDALVAPDDVFQEYVGWSREECRAFTARLADFCRSVPPGASG